MATVTKIESQKKRVGYYNIFLDGRFFCSLSDLQLSSWHLKVGQELTTDEITQLASESESQKTYNRAIYYLQYGSRTVWQMQTYLTSKGYEEDYIAVAIERLQRENYLNDTQYATSWVEDRNRNKPRSKRQLYAELLKKRIPKDVIQDILEAQGSDTQLNAIKKIIEKKTKQTRYQDPKKLTEYLLRQGFTYSDIKGVLKLF